MESISWQVTPFAVTFLVSAALVLVVIVVTFRHITVRGARYFLFLTSSVGVWSLFMALEYAAVEPWGKIIFAKFEYLGISTIGVTWLMFALSYNRKEKWLTRRNVALLFVIPAITIILAFTNELHGLLWPDIRLSSPIPGADLIYVHGPAFWLNFAYVYICLAVGTFIIIDNSLRARDIHRWQMLGLISSAIVPWVGNVIYVANLSPIPGLDLTPIGFSLSAIIIAFSIFYLGLFDLVPIARDLLVESLMDGVLVLDTSSRVADINPRSRELLGIGKERVVGRNIADFVKPWGDLIERFRGVESAQTEVHFNNQPISDVEVRISPLADEHGYLIGRLIVVRDISERKKLEKLRDDLIHAMVHDLRNPLSSIMLSFDLLKSQLSDTLTPEQLMTLETGEQSSGRILHLVNSILDISRLESGQMRLKRESVSVQKMVTEALKTQAVFAREKQILLEEAIPANLPPVMVDEKLMGRVLQNLLDNAVKFSTEDGVIQVRAEEYVEQREIVLSVRDSGPGIPDEMRGRLFEKFASGNTKGSGSGLGLAFCRLVLEAHGGRIWADEKVESGASILLSIPV